MLYKFRRGIAPYKRMDGDIYEDTTCRDHDNCRVRVKAVDDHYEICELMNDEAREHEWDQMRHDYDTHLFPKRSQVLRAWYMNRINAHKKWQREAKERFEKNKAELAQMQMVKERPQAIHRMDFDYPIIYAWRNTNSYGEKIEIYSTVNESVVTHKVMGKNGLEYLMCYDDDKQIRIYDTDHKRWMDVRVIKTDYEGDYTIDNFCGFYSREDMDALRHNEEYKSLQRAMENGPASIARYDDEIEKLQVEMEKAVKEEETKEDNL